MERPRQADPTGLGAWEVADLIAQGRISCVGLMEACLDRIAAVGDGINAIVALRGRDALMAEAAAVDGTPPRGRLHGLPYAAKDLVEVEGLPTTHGSPIFRDHVSTADDLLAARVRAAGAIFIGKTTTPEFGLGSHTHSPVHGVTRNPHNLAKSAGGSSGGAAAALAARMLWVADGSDMMGSLRNPAAFNNVYGFRPSHGLVPGIPGGDMSLDGLSTAGPMGRSPRDVALLLDVIAGPDPRVPHSVPREPSYEAALGDPGKGFRIGWLGDWDGFFPVEPEIVGLCEQALRALEREGCAIVRAVPDFDPARLLRAWHVLRSRSVACDLARHYDRPGERALLKPEAVWEIETGRGFGAEEIRAADAVRSEWSAALARLLADLDALAMPSAQVFPFDAGLDWPRRVCGAEMRSYRQWMEIAVPASLAGVPALGVPVGFGREGLPAGMQLVGPKGADLHVLRIGHAYHHATDWPSRRPPPL